MFDLIRRKRHGADAVLIAFDLLELDGEDMRRSPIEDRKRKLAKLVRGPHPGIVLNEFFEGDGDWSPQGQMIIRDMVALGQGTQIPPHIDVLADIASIHHSFAICKEAASICEKAASHLERKNRRNKTANRVGTNVFIGHGRSGLWRELKDFIQDRMRLPWDEFNRVPVAGITNVARLSEMLDAAAIAFLVMTAEDEMADGELQARMNVVHEAGLFQGRLGFTRAIVLWEEGCKGFSNVEGLGQIRFPKGNIGAAFEEVRRLLEREGLIMDGSGPPQ